MIKTGEKPSLIRDINLKLVIDSLRNEDLSVTDLALKLNLSNTAIKKIINELIELNIVSMANKVKSDVAGRRRVNYRYKSDFSKIAVINFAQKEIYICDMSGKIIKSEKLKMVEKINRDYILETAKYLTNEKENFLAIGIVTIGKVEPLTHNFIYALNIEDYQTINYKNIFSKYFDCPIVVINDIYAGLKGEISSGVFKVSEVLNGLYVYIGDSISGGLVIDGKLYEGSHSFAGEIGLISSNNYERLEQVVSLKKIRESCNNLEFSEIINCYNKKDPNIVKIVNNMAHELAIVLKNITVLLDIELIVLSGELTQLGNDFLEEINKYFTHFPYLKARIEYSKLQEDAIKIGSIEEVVMTGINSILQSRKEKN